MARSLNNSKSILIVVACICFAIGVLDTLGVDLTDKINWTDAGLFFGFLAFIF
jgi:hypothetical protein